MKKSDFNRKMRDYVREHLSPKDRERTFVSEIYESIQNVLGTTNCLQIGSYPRFTSITPLHDLDVLYILGNFESNSDPANALNSLQTELEANYENPTEYKIEISRQTHSITIKFQQGVDEVFSVDIVPAYISGVNYFGNDTYFVPEIAVKSHADRRRIKEEVAHGRKMEWIKTDPRGYTTVATNTNAVNDDFRKAVKFIKGWRSACKKVEKNFPLKSFHLEQIITRYFQDNPTLEIYDAIFKFFRELPDFIQEASIPDRADSTKMIDEYINDLTDNEKKWVTLARDHFLISLENLTDNDSVSELFNIRLHQRACNSEEYLFDYGIPIFTEIDFSISAQVLPREGGFRGGFLDTSGVIAVDRQIHFRVGTEVDGIDLYKWKVKNDNSSEQPRGEITDHSTLHDPEHTKYSGSHYVECFAIKDGVCVGRVRQNVVLHWLNS